MEGRLSQDFQPPHQAAQWCVHIALHLNTLLQRPYRCRTTSGKQTLWLNAAVCLGLVDASSRAA